jgi:hypothetical protein
MVHRSQTPEHPRHHWGAYEFPVRCIVSKVDPTGKTWDPEPGRGGTVTGTLAGRRPIDFDRFYCKGLL